VFTRLQWLSVFATVAVVAAIEVISDTILDEEMPFPVDAVVVALVVFATSATLSWLAFREIRRLTAMLERRNRELALRTATARGLQEVAVAVAAGSDLQSTLVTVGDRALALLGAEVAMLDVAVAGTGHLRLRSPASGEFPIAADGSDDDTFAVQGLSSTISSPIRVGADTVGELSVATRTGRTFDVDDVESISALAGMAGVAIRNHELRGTMRELAVRGERERIAREMHDGLAQVLAYVSAKSAVADELLAIGRVPEARAQLADLGAAARSTYVDVREAILGLTTPVDAEHGLAGAIEEYGARFAEASKLAVTVGATSAARTAHLSPGAEAQAFRIVQEALTNVRKHAVASRVSLTLDVVAGVLIVVVADDGRGFRGPHESGSEAGSIPLADGSADWPHYGLRTMVARATDIGGTVTWTSGEDGTRIELRIPVDAAGPASEATAAGDGAEPA
jgi:signal transduction histidine kinase